MDEQSLKIIITDDGSQTLYRKDLNETYHSFHGAIQESKHVFIEAGLATFVNSCDRENIKILEIGFGTGLNALLALQFAEKNGRKVEYHSLETLPVSDELVSQLKYPELIDQTNARPHFQKMHSVPWNELVEINPFFHLKKIKKSLDSFSTNEKFDIIFFDAFAPSKQPEMWTIDALSNAVAHLDRNGIFTTYCAKGQVKRDLAELGLKVESLPGPPGKKEMTRAIKIG